MGRDDGDERVLQEELDDHGGRVVRQLHAVGVHGDDEARMGRQGRGDGATVDLRRGSAVLRHRHHDYR